MEAGKRRLLRPGTGRQDVQKRQGQEAGEPAAAVHKGEPVAAFETNSGTS